MRFVAKSKVPKGVIDSRVFPAPKHILQFTGDIANVVNGVANIGDAFRNSFDFRFVRDGDRMLIEIYQFPTEDRDAAEREMVYSHEGTVADVIEAFAVTFDQLYADRDTDEFEFNWRQPFPHREYEEFKSTTTAIL